MALVWKDRVLETTTTTGTGILTLAGAVTGYQTFAAVGDGNTCYFCIYAVDAFGNPSGVWEVGLGTYTASGTTLARTTVYANSSGGATALDLAAGTKRVMLTAAAQHLTTIPVVNGGTGLTALGSALQVLRVNSGGTALEYGTLSTGLTVGATAITSGTSGRLLYDDGGALGETAAVTYATTGTHQTITAQVATDVPLAVVLHATQSANGFEVRSSGGTALASVSSEGNVAANNYRTDKGVQSVVAGVSAGGNLSTGAGNVVVGYGAGSAMPAGSTQNTILGYHAGFSYTGNAGTFFGYNAGRSTTASGCTFVGYWAGYANTSGDVTAVGDQALAANTTGSNNTAVGRYSLQANTTGFRHTAVGMQSFASLTSGDNNTACGAFGGLGITSGSGLTFIGNSAGLSSTASGLSNATAVGYNAQVTQSASVVLGGTGGDAVRGGIGTTAPAAKWHVKTETAAHLGLIVQGTTSQSGVLAQLRGESSTSAREQADIDTAWADSTDATRKARLVLRAWDTAARECLRLEADGTYGLASIGGAAVTASTALTVVSPTAAYKALVVRGATSQTADYFQVQTSASVTEFSGIVGGTLGVYAGIKLLNAVSNEIAFTSVAGNPAAVFFGSSSTTTCGEGRLGLGDIGRVTWHSNSDGRGGGDTGLARHAAGAVRVTNAWTGFGALLAGATDAATNSVSDGLTLNHTTSGTPAAGFGIGVSLKLQSSTTADQDAAAVQATWADATHATRKARLTLSAYDTAARECLRLEASGSAPMLGLYGTAAVAQYATTGTVTGYTGGGGTALTHSDTFTGNTGSTAYTLGDIVRALKLLGVIAA